MVTIGLVGKPSSGKSSFFKAATLKDVEISEVPFTTIKPNVGIAFVSFNCVEKEFGVKCNPRLGFCKNGKRFVPVKLIDVGGLIPGSHAGRGIGNKFLDDLRQADVLIQVIDMSGLTDEEGKPTDNFDPEIEIKFLEEEINLWFESIVKRGIEKIKKEKDPVEALAKQFSGLGASKKDIEEVLSKVSYTNVKKFAEELRKKVKPILLAANKIDIKKAQDNFVKLSKKYQNLVPTSALAEIILKELDKKGVIEYLPGNGFTVISEEKLNEREKRALSLIKELIEKFGSTGVQTCLNKAVFDLANYIPVYPVADSKRLTDKEGNILPDVFLVKRGTKLKEFAYKIHTDIGKGFICGIDAKTGKKLSADYVLKPNDVVEIKFRK